MGAIILVSSLFQCGKDPLQEELEGVLPGVNCGGCGYSGCSAYASALADKSEEDTTLCTAGGQDTATAIAEALGEANSRSSSRKCLLSRTCEHARAI